MKILLIFTKKSTFLPKNTILKNQLFHEKEKFFLGGFLTSIQILLSLFRMRGQNIPLSGFFSLTSNLNFKMPFVLRSPAAAKFAEIKKIATFFIKTLFKDSKQVK